MAFLQQFFAVHASPVDSVVAKVSDYADRNVGLAWQLQVRIAHGALCFFFCLSGFVLFHTKKVRF